MSAELDGAEKTLEAAFSATVKMVNPKTQFEWLVTTRADTASQGLGRLALVEKWALDNGYVSMDAYIDQRKAERETARQTEPTHEPRQAVSGDIKTNLLTKIIVTNPGRVEFHCDGMQYPMKDSRGAKMIVSLFDPDLPFSEADFATEGVFTSRSGGWAGKQIFVDWIAKEVDGKKYRDVVRVHS